MAAYHLTVIAKANILNISKRRTHSVNYFYKLKVSCNWTQKCYMKSKSILYLMDRDKALILFLCHFIFLALWMKFSLSLYLKTYCYRGSVVTLNSTITSKCHVLNKAINILKDLAVIRRKDLNKTGL